MTKAELRALVDAATISSEVWRDYSKPRNSQKPETRERMLQAHSAREDLEAISMDLAELVIALVDALEYDDRHPAARSAMAAFEELSL
jgi:hypothetical protein